jgi:hypothetical protein
VPPPPPTRYIDPLRCQRVIVPWIGLRHCGAGQAAFGAVADGADEFADLVEWVVDGRDGG